ncbi:uncharacterized protein LOC131669870 [Phymastichus coffea]|uniref:uncharacterized protein LOC131669870 n=1 Tax=Phymastichus coffea TaxID=108790 RepID=UPI00273A8D5A|nr:uncharacterized protein LOC131669870 [Phymastichus coffea]
MDGKEVFNNKYWALNRTMMTLIGLWPYQNRYAKIFIRTFVLLATHSILVFLVNKTIIEWGKNFAIVCENIAAFFYFKVVITKYITNCVAEQKLQYLYERITEDWNTFNKEDEQRVLARSASYGRVLTIGYAVFLNICGVGFTLIPTIYPALLDIVLPLNHSREKSLCLQVDYFVDHNVHYYKILFHTVGITFFTVEILSAIDSTYVNCVQHIVGLFGLVDLKLDKAFKLTQIKSRSINEQKKIHNYENTVARFVDLLQSTYTKFFFMCMAAVLCELSFGTVALMISTVDYVYFMRLLLAWLGIILYLFYISIPGQRVTDASLSISESIFYSGWHEFPLETQKYINFMILRCSVPCQFTAGPLFVMNIENCGIILKTAMSYCTVVAATNKD